MPSRSRIVLAALAVVLAGAPATLHVAEGATPWSPGDVIVGSYQRLNAYSPTGVDHGSSWVGSPSSDTTKSFSSSRSNVA